MRLQRRHPGKKDGTDFGELAGGQLFFGPAMIRILSIEKGYQWAGIENYPRHFP